MKRNTWIVLGVVIVLGLVYVLTKEEEVSVGVKRLELPRFDGDQVTKVVIGGKNPAELRKLDGSWKLVLSQESDQEAKLVPADQSHMSALIEAALGVRHSYYVTRLPEKYPDLGLAEKELTQVKIYNQDKILWEIDLGKNASEGSGRYAKVPGDENAYVVRGSFWQLTRNNKADWRDRTIASIKTKDLQGLKFFKKDKIVLAIAKNSEGPDNSFVFSAEQPELPKSYRLLKGELDRLVQAISSLRASGFIDEPKKLENPVLAVNIQTSDEEKRLLEIFVYEKDRYLVKSFERDQVFEISKYHFDKLDKSSADFRDLSVMKFDQDMIMSLELNAPKNFVSLKKQEKVWNIIRPKKLPKDFKFDARAVDDILSSLSKLKAVRLAQKKDKAQDSRWFKKALVKLVDKDQREINLRVGVIRGNKSELLVQGNIDSENYVVKKIALENFYEGVNAFKKEDFELPPIGPGTKGFDSLPVDIQRKLMNASRNKKKNS